MLEQSFKRLQQLSNTNGTDYKNLVGNNAKEIITGVINDLCADKCNDIKQTCAALETTATEKLNDILTSTSNIPQTKSNIITANIE